MNPAIPTAGQQANISDVGELFLCVFGSRWMAAFAALRRTALALDRALAFSSSSPPGPIVCPYNQFMLQIFHKCNAYAEFCTFHRFAARHVAAPFGEGEPSRAGHDVGEPSLSPTDRYLLGRMQWHSDARCCKRRQRYWFSTR